MILFSILWHLLYEIFFSSYLWGILSLVLWLQVQWWENCFLCNAKQGWWFSLEDGSSTQGEGTMAFPWAWNTTISAWWVIWHGTIRLEEGCITDKDQKERVNQMIEDQKPFKGKPLLVASASGKWTQLFPWLKVVFLCVVFPARVFPHTIANRPKTSLFVFVKLSHSMQKLCVVWKKRVNGRVFLIEWKRKWNGYKELCFYVYKLSIKEEKDQNRKTNYCTCLTNWSVD